MPIEITIDKCPCCGDVACLKEDTNSLLLYYGYSAYYIVCLGCGLRTDYGTKDSVIRKWNRREYNGC